MKNLTDIKRKLRKVEKKLMKNAEIASNLEKIRKTLADDLEDQGIYNEVPLGVLNVFIAITEQYYDKKERWAKDSSVREWVDNVEASWKFNPRKGALYNRKNLAAFLFNNKDQGLEPWDVNYDTCLHIIQTLTRKMSQSFLGTSPVYDLLDTLKELRKKLT